MIEIDLAMGKQMISAVAYFGPEATARDPFCPVTTDVDNRLEP